MSKEVQVKNYRITFFKKPLKNKIKYEVDVRAITEKDALTQAYSRIGSKHRVPQQLLKVHSIKEISIDEIKNPILKEIASDDKVKIHLTK
ncbi:MAG: 50S ribosomal protein L18a [Candidatus Heimdallarchaeota archaeon]